MKIKFNVRAMQKHGPACWNGQVVKKKKTILIPRNCQSQSWFFVLHKNKNKVS